MESALDVFTIVHVAISLVGILSGFVVLLGMIRNQPLDAVTALFLLTTVLTSVTGFGFQLFFANDFPSWNTPGIKLGVVSLLVLVPAIVARYPKQMAGSWRGIYVVTAMIAQLLNMLVLIVQSFQKVPALHELAPTQSNEPAFVGAQLANLILFLVLTPLAVKRFHPAPRA